MLLTTKENAGYIDFTQQIFFFFFFWGSFKVKFERKP